MNTWGSREARSGERTRSLKDLSLPWLWKCKRLAASLQFSQGPPGPGYVPATASHQTEHQSTKTQGNVEWSQGLPWAADPLQQKNTSQKDGPLEWSTCNLTPGFRAIDPRLLIATASSIGGRAGLWQLLVLNLPGQLLEHLFQKQAREGGHFLVGVGSGKRSMGKRGDIHTLEMG